MDATQKTENTQLNEELIIASADSARKRNNERGMTLIEIIIVVTLIVLIVGVFIGPAVFSSGERAKASIVKSAVAKIQTSIYEFQLHERRCPKNITEMKEKEYVNDANDPWGNEYVVFCGSKKPPKGGAFGASSFGPDGQKGNKDDINSWDE